jgi:hypothetical protein
MAGDLLLGRVCQPKVPRGADCCGIRSALQPRLDLMQIRVFYRNGSPIDQKRQRQGEHRHGAPGFLEHQPSKKVER